MRNRTEIDNNILGMDMESEGNEYKNVRGEKVKDDISIEGLVQRNTQEQMREDKITISTDRQIELSETSDKRSISVSNGIRQSDDISIEDKIKGLDNESEQSSNQRTEMMDKMNRGQLIRVIDYQNNNKHVNKKRISIGLGSNTDIRQSKTIDTIRLFVQVFKKLQDQEVLIRSDNTTAIYDIEKWKAKESLKERIKQVFYLVKKLQLQITTIHIPGKLNLATDSLSRLCRSGDCTLKNEMIQVICKTWNYMPEIDIFATQYNKLINNYATVDLKDLGKYFHNVLNYQCNKVKLYIHPPIPVLNRVLQKMNQDKAEEQQQHRFGRDNRGTLNQRIYQLKSFPWISRQDYGDRTENERQGSKTSTRHCGRLPVGLVADVGRDLLMRSIEEIVKKDAKVILTEGIAFHTRQNNSVASTKSYPACLTTMLFFMYKENLASSTTSKLNNKALMPQQKI
ncbi:MAG: hypothetical protein EZS28_035354 [Streblomastix strix]|uniref:Uncharacterized protein n=1 Tax=Streblomastix strix TaxID=222440 RepID=A0A5J4UEU7_9EUKA|nr:MAG: hypothetical protein EZS28_035354 [Streblomastix strix]